MIIRNIVFFSLLFSFECIPSKQRCLTGYMTEVQSWVDKMGVLTIGSEDYDRAIDLSANANPVQVLEQKIHRHSSDDGIPKSANIRYLSLARCRLHLVPTVFRFEDSEGHYLADTLEYITFYGNNFTSTSSPEMYDVTINATSARVKSVTSPFQRQLTVTWSRGFEQTDFPRLKELDLRACSIQVISDEIFKGMLNLEALYIGENEVYYIDANAFASLNNLKHLDFSRNAAYDEKGSVHFMNKEWFHALEALENLLSLDFSFTKLQRNTSILKSIGPKLKRLSLCETGLTNLEDGVFSKTSLRILDLSGNNGIFGGDKVLSGLEDHLEVLYAKDTGLKALDFLENLKKLEVLDLSINEIPYIYAYVAETLRNLQILDLEGNRITSWFTPTFSLIPNLKLLSLKDNNINIISEDMIEDLAEVHYIAMSSNFIVCNCHTRDFFDLALQNEQRYRSKNFTEKSRNLKEPKVYEYHRGFIDYNEQLSQRNAVFINCAEEICDDLNEETPGGRFLLLDFTPNAYMCLPAAGSKPIQFSSMAGCSKNSRDIDYDTVINNNIRTLYMLLVIPGFLLMLIVIFIFRRNIRYCLITVRNSAMLSLIHKNEVVDECTIFHYDVFVSYCNEDRNWVLDQLLPHLESECSVSACLHERDFQVGHSILENIASCMDRSRSIMLIISQRFLLSKWCQFEMHLAQHRLLETRREDLTLVLLEDIPRRLRPNTLHYLMLTKTYIVWPSENSEREQFWRRVKRSLMTMKLRHTSLEGVSLA